MFQIPGTGDGEAEIVVGTVETERQRGCRDDSAADHQVQRGAV